MISNSLHISGRGSSDPSGSAADPTVLQRTFSNGEAVPFPSATKGLKFLHLPEDTLETFIHPEKIDTLRRAFGIVEEPPTAS